jgi:uncharacterized membrane protein YbhN (UPF0104 family)
VWRQLSTLSPAWVAILVVATALNIATFAFPWMVVIPGLGFLSALRVTQASTALISVVPGGAPMGMAITFGMLRSRRVPARDAGFAVALTGLWNQVAIFIFPVFALGLVAGAGRLPRPLDLVAIAGFVLAVAICAVIAFSLASPGRALRLGDFVAALASRALALVGRDPVRWNGEALVMLRRELLALVRRRWLALTVATLANQLTGFLMLDLSLRAVGIPVAALSVAQTFAAWSIGRLLGSLPITPGGIGVVELGLVGALVAFGGHDAKVVAGVLLYRFLVIVPTLVLGALAGLTWRLRR